MKTFLQDLAGFLWNRYQDKMDKIIVVLPNKRGGLYLKKHLAQEASKTIWAPRILSIEKLISEKSGLRFMDHFSLMLELFQVHRNIKGDQADEFQEFLHWGSTLIKDFNDTDLYLADARQLYTYLDAARAITSWNPDGRPLSEFQKDYLSFFQSLLEYYEQLTAQLESKHSAYPGFAFRKVAENPPAYFNESQGFHYIFAGFNALTPAEEKIIRYLMDEGKAECIWDSDTYYLDDIRQEAGTFLRKYRSEWEQKEFHFEGKGWEGNKKIDIIGVAGYVGQAKACGNILSAMGPEEANDTCVVLADENLLLPVLNSIPAGIGEFNITMGFPLGMSALHSLITDVLKMHENAHRAQEIYERSEPEYYLNDLIKITGHPYIIQWAGKSESNPNLPVSLAVTNQLRKEQRFSVPLSQLKKSFEPHGISAWNKLSQIFEPWYNESSDIMQLLEQLLGALRDYFTGEEQAGLEREFIYQYGLIVQSIRQSLSENAISINITSAGMILRQLTSSASIPFYGEPLIGFQLMGVLETRNLDFKNIIMLSVNDDVIPGGKMQQSYIPQDIRTEFGLPSYKEKEAVYAYHFYRLLQRSENIHLLYNTEADRLSSGDKSRFIAQLLHELPTKNPAAIIKERIISLEPRLNLPPADIIIEKNPAIIQLLKDKAVKGFAPSSINTYLGCSLRFYFQELMGLREENEATESMDAATLGTTIHEALHKIYKDHLQTVFTPDLFSNIKSKALQILRDEFQQNLNGSDIRYGKNLLLFKVAESFLMNFLDYESAQIKENPTQQVFVEYCEHPLEARFPFADGESSTILLKGRADRIDSINGRIRIIDYKTGKVADAELNWQTLEAMIDGEKNDKSMQLLIYAYLYFKKYPEYQGTIESGIVSFRSLSHGLMSLQIAKDKEITPQTMIAFERYLQQLFTDIFDPALPFLQTEDQTKCILCPFRELCYR